MSAANEKDQTLVSVAFDSVEKLTKQHFQLITESFFVELVNCLVAFGNNTNFPDKRLFHSEKEKEKERKKKK